jgi:hypothetical protein
MWRCFLKTMNKDEVFSQWAPEGSPWSRWAKPVLFAHLDSEMAHLPVEDAAVDVSWAPPPGERVALVLDLPGTKGVLAGIALAGRGYQPVPLYNAVPLPFSQAPLDPQTGKEVAAVNVLPILRVLGMGAESLAQMNLPGDAPPAFLLDANRRGDGKKMQPDEFDNRSISFTTDFPSANFLASQGIQRIILIQENTLEPQSDLAHSLCRWQDGGLKLQRLRLHPPSPLETFHAVRPAWYGAMFQRVLSGIGLGRSASGGFGAWVPDSSAVG